MLNKLYFLRMKSVGKRRVGKSKIKKNYISLLKMSTLNFEKKRKF